jgi:hypothetical protein
MKKKFRLQIEEIHIEQFQVQPTAAVTRGTVRGFGFGSEYEGNCGTYTCECGSQGYSAPCRYCQYAPITYSCDGPAECV